MDAEEFEGTTSCMGCGAALSPERERGYSVGAEGALCFVCAEQRGGRYDAARDEWSTPPDVSDLARAE